MPAAIHNDHEAARRNLELKARVTAEALADFHARLRTVTGCGPDIERQEDRYFRVPEGRLKLRTIAVNDGAARAELIAYRRPNEALSRWSAYRITPVDVEQAGSLAATLESVLSTLVMVRKRREIFLYGATRIHLDEVDDLGAFVELETVIATQGDDEAEAEHRTVIDMLALDRWPSCAGSYSDLLLDGADTHTNEDQKQGT